jgi:hydroxymethylbilane synthase
VRSPSGEAPTAASIEGDDVVSLRLGTRGSALARWQADHLIRLLREVDAGLAVELVVLQTLGDRITDVPLARIGDRGLFTKEIDSALLRGDIDLAIHSFKDVPTRLPEGITIGAVLEREDARDALVCAPEAPPALALLPAGARIGTSSLRRRSQLLHARPDLRVDDLRGNLDTRLERVGRGDFDAVLLACAGIVRLGRSAAISQRLDAPSWLPAVGQGALAVACRADDGQTIARLASLDHGATRAATAAERSFLRQLEGGCQVPIGALANVDGDTLELHGFVASLDGATMLRGQGSAGMADAVGCGERLAAQLLDAGAGRVLAEVREAAAGGLPYPSAP